MLGLLLIAAMGEVAGVTPSDFDLTALGPNTALIRSDRHGARQYLLPELDEPEDAKNGIEVKLRWRKVRVTVPIAGLQPPF